MSDPEAARAHAEHIAEQNADWWSEANCPDCGHPAIKHADRQHWPEGLCSKCRREMNPFESGNPRKAEDVCQNTSSDVRALVEMGGES